MNEQEKEPLFIPTPKAIELHLKHTIDMMAMVTKGIREALEEK